MKNTQIKSRSKNNTMDTKTWFRRILRSTVCFSLSLGISGLAFAQEVVVETDGLLCEGQWVTISASAPGCTITSVSWQKTNTDGSTAVVDGSQYYHEFAGNSLKTKSDGAYTATLNCDDGSVLQGDGQVMQQTDDSKC